MQKRSGNHAQGLDVSHWQGAIDWAKVRSSGKSFVFIKASQGTSRVDPNFKINATGAKAAGLLVGPYHFLDAITPGAARQEAQHFYATLLTAGVEFDLPPVMDYESNPGQLSKHGINEIAKSFLAEIEQLTGRTPIIYTGNSFAGQFTAELGKYPLWVARYSHQAPYDVPGWNTWSFWQYSDTGSIPGMTGNVDLNEFSGTVKELQRFCQPRTAPSANQGTDSAYGLLESRIAALERRLNLSGTEPLPKWAEPAVIAGKQAGAITTSADKGVPELVALQMLYNLGLLEPRTQKSKGWEKGGIIDED